MSEDERAIRELIATWMTASKAGDHDTVLSLMADDAVFMVPGREPFGKEAFAAASKGMQGVRFDGTGDIVELKVLGDWAWLRNRLKVTIAPPGGSPTTRSGYTLTILRKEPDGKWRLARDANLLA
ncbi:MAG TPA: SgcJ/EcaC family oxidoreductase [Hyphomicrobiaceae bacterium]|jgi:uncharacterized protein (TIGR02246 family)